MWRLVNFEATTQAAVRAAYLPHRSSIDTTEVLKTVRHTVRQLTSKTRCETALYKACTRLHEAADLYAVDALYS